MPDRAPTHNPVTTTAGAVPREWTLLLVLAGVQFTHIMDFMVMMPLGPQFMRLLDLTPAQFGWLVSIYTFSASLCGFIAALYIDRFDRKHALLFLYGGLALSTLMCALAPGFGTLLAARAMAGAFGGILSATVFSIIADVIPEQRRATATGTVMMAFSVSAILGVPIGLYLANHFSWRAPFVLLSGLGMIFLAIAWRVLPALRSHMDHHREPHLLKQLHAIFSVPRHLNAFALIATLMFAGFSIIPYISPYLVANAGLPETRSADSLFLRWLGDAGLIAQHRPAGGSLGQTQSLHRCGGALHRADPGYHPHRTCLAAHGGDRDDLLHGAGVRASGTGHRPDHIER